MAKQTYSDLLRDPRWQKMRLRKLEAAEWRCERCMDGETTLNVHHNRYVKGHMPWEYDEAELVVLCEPCHEEEHEAKDLRAALMARLAADGPISTGDFFAYGMGAISSFDWLLDEPTHAMLRQIQQSSPNQFAAGRAASSIFELLISNGFFEDKNAMVNLAERLYGDQEFGAAFLVFLEQNGLPRRKD